jgi:hypothetical protein
MLRRSYRRPPALIGAIARTASPDEGQENTETGMYESGFARDENGQRPGIVDDVESLADVAGSDLMTAPTSAGAVLNDFGRFQIQLRRPAFTDIKRPQV